jgi:hypothetical protein
MESLIDSSLKVLNDLFQSDPKAILNLVDYRVDVGEEVADHPTVQVQVNCDNVYKLGILGILNGIIGVHSNGEGYIAAEYDGDILLGFVRNPTTLE